MAVRKTVRIYDLAKELKQDTKRVMEELRRAGADVSVASNSVPMEFADKLRNKYLTNAEAPAKPRAIKVIKAAKKEDVPVVEIEEAAPAAIETPAVPEPETPPPVVEVPAVAAEPRKSTKVLKPKAKPVPAVEVDAPSTAEPEPEMIEEAPAPEPAEVSEQPAASPAPIVAGKTIKV